MDLADNTSSIDVYPCLGSFAQNWARAHGLDKGARQLLFRQGVQVHDGGEGAI